MASNSTPSRDNKRKARGDVVPSYYMRDGVLFEDTQMKFLIMYKAGQYDIVGQRDIWIDKSDDSLAIVYDKSKPYEVAIVARGNLSLLALSS